MKSMHQLLIKKKPDNAAPEDSLSFPAESPFASLQQELDTLEAEQKQLEGMGEYRLIGRNPNGEWNIFGSTGGQTNRGLLRATLPDKAANRIRALVGNNDLTAEVIDLKQALESKIVKIKATMNSLREAAREAAREATAATVAGLGFFRATTFLNHYPEWTVPIAHIVYDYLGTNARLVADALSAEEQVPAEEQVAAQPQQKSWNPFRR